jgi:hypothetical protein
MKNELNLSRVDWEIKEVKKKKSCLFIINWVGKDDCECIDSLWVSLYKNFFGFFLNQLVSKFPSFIKGEFTKFFF